MKRKLLSTMTSVLVCASMRAQVNSGSNGSDGAFNPTTNVVINMADHPTGIYQFSSVNITNTVQVTFIPNVNSTPVVWLVQSNCVIAGTVVLNGSSGVEPTGGSGGPGGFSGGLGPLSDQSPPGAGAGPGGGKVTSSSTNLLGANASYGSLGGTNSLPRYPVGSIYGNDWLVPLRGGSGGGGGYANYSTYPFGGQGMWRSGGGGGGGAILIAANQSIVLTGAISANGGGATPAGGGGSGGAIRLIAPVVAGKGSLQAAGGSAGQSGVYDYTPPQAGMGRVRIDSLSDQFAGFIQGVATRGFQPIIIPPTNQAVSLAIQSVAEIAVPPSPTGASLTPDVIVPGQQANPISIIVHCINIPPNTDIIVDVKPANGQTISVVGKNNGTQASSTATVSVTMPRGAGTIQAKAVSGIVLAVAGVNDKVRSLAETGWTADGERFAQVEVTATLGKGQEIAYITESGKRFVIPSN